jgi:hypothetical protein
MKSRIMKLLHPTNRRVRILVGLLLVGLLVIQVTQSVATDHQVNATIQTVDGEKVFVSNPSLWDTVCRLAESDHVGLLKLGLAEMDRRNLSRYSATFVKQEKIRGKLSPEQHIQAKYMARPFSVSMVWTRNAPTGDALVYVEGKYPDEQGRSQMIVRPSSPLIQKLVGGSVPRLPDGPDAMRNTLRPCTMFGFHNSLSSLIDVYENARRNGDCHEQWGYRDEKTGKQVKFAKVGGRTCIVLARYLPRKPGYPAKRTLTFLDLEYLVPLRVIGTDWDNSLICNYEYRDVKFNAPLGPEDFTPQANGIKFNP